MDEPITSACERKILNRRDQICVAGLLAAWLLALAAGWLQQGAWRGWLVDIERSASSGQQYQLDVNRSEWWEWTLLPRIGETLAQRIVADRRQRGPFTSREDLLRVKGIGPRTLEGMLPYLAPVAVPKSTGRGVPDAD
jgi:competence protein ComEA